MRPRLKGSWQAIRSSDRVVLLLNELSSRRFRIGDPSEVAWRLLREADGTRSSDAVVTSVSEATGIEATAVGDGFRALHELGLFEDAALTPPPEMPTDYLTAHARNVYFFSEYETKDRTRFDMALALCRARVALLGLGGTGSWILASLLAAGVGFVRAIDCDEVGAENLGRQILYRRRDLGLPKAEAMGREIADFSHVTSFEGRVGRVDSADAVRTLIAGCDLLVVGCVGPRFTLYRWVNEACLEHRVPYLIVETRQVGPLVVPGVSACLTCYERFLRGPHPYYDTVVSALDRNAAAVERMPQFGPLVAYSATRAGIEVVQFLTGYAQPSVINHVVQLDGPDPGWRSFEFPRDPECRSCRSVTV